MLLEKRFKNFSKYYNSIQQHFNGHVIVGGNQWKYVKCYKLDQGLRNMSRKQVTNKSNVERRVRKPSLPFERYSLVTVDTLGPLPEDENWFSFVVVIVDNLSKFVGLYSARSTSKDFVGALIQWVGMFGYLRNSIRWWIIIYVEIIWGSHIFIRIQAFSCSDVSATSECLGQKTHGRDILTFTCPGFWKANKSKLKSLGTYQKSV